MKEKLKFVVLVVAVVALVGTQFYRIGYDEGKHYGIGLGVHASLDSVKQILYKQLENDSTATELIFEGDTMSYHLTKKILVEKFNR